MKMGSRPRILPEAIAIVAAVLVTSFVARAASPATPDALQVSTDARAVAWLAAEVPKWHAENSCYSCHNNGDAVRALVQASARGHDVAAPLADTLAFLQKPADWERNSRGGALDDQGLARIQFAAALTDAAAAGLVPRDALAEAAALVVGGQADDGSWHLDESNSLGSPATYGRALATWSARRTLLAARAASHDARSGDLTAAIARADAWIRTLTPLVTPDVAAVLLVLADATDARGRELRAVALETLLTNQNRSGGWGPYPTVRPEPFDTAIALVALYAQPRAAENTEARDEGVDAAIARGRAWLRDAALPDGSWLETTRPAGQRSYAQRISTAGWATLALLSGPAEAGATGR